MKEDAQDIKYKLNRLYSDKFRYECTLDYRNTSCEVPAVVARGELRRINEEIIANEAILRYLEK